MQNLTPVAVAALGLELRPGGPVRLRSRASGAGRKGAGRWLRGCVFPCRSSRPTGWFQTSAHMFRWAWFALYAMLPVAIAWLLLRATAADAGQGGDWRDALILLALGLAVDLRWFDRAWPTGLRALNELFLVDAGLVRLSRDPAAAPGRAFDFHLRWSDWQTGLRELALFTPIVIVLGLALGFLHPHRNLPGIASALLRWVGIFFFTAVPEELYSLPWMQNLLERRVGTAGGSGDRIGVVRTFVHFNKRSAHFNWRYVLLATRRRDFLRASLAETATPAGPRRLPMPAWIGCGGCGSRTGARRSTPSLSAWPRANFACRHAAGRSVICVR